MKLLLELRRQLFHLVLGVAMAAAVFLLPQQLSVLLLLFAAILVLMMRHTHRVFAPLRWFIETFERPGEQPFKGAFHLALGSAAAALFFNPPYAAAGILVLAVGDSFSTIFGTRYGGRKLYRQKTLEGAIAFLVSSALSLILFFPLPTALLVSVVSALVELYSPLDDNLLIPSVAAFLLTNV